MNIIITGASRGIGYDTALQLAKAGHQVLCLSRNEERLQLLKKTSLEFGADHLDYLAFDLAQPNQVALKAKLDAWARVDVLINNAGLLINKPFLELTAADWQALFTVNLFSVTELIRQVVPFMASAKRPHILNIGSMGGFQGSAKFPGLSAYSASKAALASLTECLAEEFKEQNISVNCLTIGAVQTEMLEAAFPGYQAPLQSHEMAEFFAYFATKGQQFFNGKVLPVSLSTP